MTLLNRLTKTATSLADSNLWLSPLWSSRWPERPRRDEISGGDVHRSQPRARVAPAPFDDGLVQLAQLIAIEDPAMRPAPPTPPQRTGSTPAPGFEGSPPLRYRPSRRVETSRRRRPRRTTGAAKAHYLPEPGNGPGEIDALTDFPRGIIERATITPEAR